MTRPRGRVRGVRLLGVVAVLGIVALLVLQRYWIYLPGLIAVLRDPIGPTRDVVWTEGPARATAPPGQRPPNIVLILADDLGYNDVTFAGGGVANGAVRTPNIDSIATAGVTFTQAYAGNATCAPSRASILTGRYATRFGFEFTPAPAPFMRLVAHRTPGGVYHAERVRDTPPLANQAVPPDEILIAELLKAHGYRTLHLGKWHLGETDTTRPEARGFDEALGFLPGGSLYLPKNDPNVVGSVQDFDPIDTFLWANLPFAVTNNRSPRFAPPRYMTDYLADEAAKAIAANRNRPFFLYLAFNAPHTPLQALRSDYDALASIADHRLRVYAAMIRALDRGVGRVLDALRTNGLERDTLVIFTSDNGGANYIGLPDINRPFRGWKATFFEGGIHVPFVAQWPAVLPRAARYDAPVAHVDVFSTAAAAAGVPLPADRIIDGVDLVPFVRGGMQAAPHRTLFWRSGHYRTVVAGGWKLQVSEHPAKQWLFDLRDDPTEQRNRADGEPDRARELRALLADWEAQQKTPLWPSLLEAPVAIDHPLGVAGASDGEYVYWAN